VPILRRLRDLREDALLSQRDLAERAGISQTTVVHAEAGTDVRFVTVHKLAEALGVPAEELVKPARRREGKDAAA
jgi:transcriptional regulator with XRE-family HTH domain